MTIDIDPKEDYAFKRLFGNEENKALLIHLLHAILLPKPDQLITDVQILNPFTDKTMKQDKQMILDVKARDQLGRQFNVEMLGEGCRLEARGWRKRDVSLWHMHQKGIPNPRRRVGRLAGFGGQSVRARAPEA